MAHREFGEIRSVGRALAALDLLIESAPVPVRVTDVSRHLEVDSATAYRLLSTLVSHGYASRMPNRTYTLGARSLPLARAWTRRLIAGARAPLERIAAATGEVVIVNQMLGEQWTVLAYRRTPGAAQLPPLRDPDAYPLWATAGGQAMLSMLPAAHCAAVLPPEPYPSLTDRTTTAWSDLRGRLREGARDGLFVEQGEADPRLWCAAIPLERGAGGEVLSLSVVMQGEPDRTRRARVLRVLRAEARDPGYGLSAGTRG